MDVRFKNGGDLKWKSFYAFSCTGAFVMELDEAEMPLTPEQWMLPQPILDKSCAIINRSEPESNSQKQNVAKTTPLSLLPTVIAVAVF